MQQGALCFQPRAEMSFATYAAAPPDGPRARALDLLPALARGEGPVSEALLSGAAQSGKTHLLHACCSAASEAGRRAVYLPLSELGPAFGPALEGYETLDLVCLDDLEAGAGSEPVERGLVLLLDGLQRRGGRMVATSSMRLERLPFAHEDVRSRFSRSVSLPLPMLSDDELEVMIEARAAQHGLALQPQLASWLLRRERREPRHLLDLVARLDAAALGERRRAVSIAFARQLLYGDRD